MNRFTGSLSLVFMTRILGCGFLFLSFPDTSEAADLKGELLSFVKAHCIACHNTKQDNGGIDFVGMDIDPTDESQAELWVRVIEQLGNGQMPPEEAETRPSPTTVEHLVHRLRKTLKVSVAEAGPTKDPTALLHEILHEHHRSICLGILILAWFGVRSVQSGSSAALSPYIPAFLVVGVICYEAEVSSLKDQITSEQLADNIHYATFHDFGFPPLPKRQPNPECQLSATYFRGNDERDPRLFNNGNYRTATIHCRLCDESGRAYSHGDKIERQAYVAFEIERGPNTPDFFFSPSSMSKMFLTRNCERFLGRYEPVADRVSFEMIEPMHRWRAMYPVDIHDQDVVDGVVYVCESRTYTPNFVAGDDVVGGARFHYAIEFHLPLRDGVLQDQADVFAGALYRTRKLVKGVVPLSEWFSHEPIPVLPSKGPDDIELLGIDEHL